MGSCSRHRNWGGKQSQFDRIFDIGVKTHLVTLIAALISVGCDSKPAPDFDLIDRYLSTWDSFAVGNSSLASQLNSGRAEFEHHLAEGLTRNDSRAASRLVYYAIVQVGGFIPLDSPLGQAASRSFSNPLPPLSESNDRRRGYFAGDLYFWWETNSNSYAGFGLIDEWKRRDFAKTVVIPMYRAAVNGRK